MTQAERAERRAKIAKYCRTHTAAEAAKFFKVGRTLVHSACAEHKVTPKEVVAEPTPTRLELVADLVNHDYTYSDLAKHYKCTRQAIQQFAAKCRAAGLKVIPR